MCVLGDTYFKNPLCFQRFGSQNANGMRMSSVFGLGSPGAGQLTPDDLHMTSDDPDVCQMIHNVHQMLPVMAPRCFPNAFQSLKEAPSVPQGAPKHPQECPSGAQEAPKVFD